MTQAVLLRVRFLADKVSVPTLPSHNLRRSSSANCWTPVLTSAPSRASPTTSIDTTTGTTGGLRTPSGALPRY